MLTKEEIEKFVNLYCNGNEFNEHLKPKIKEALSKIDINADILVGVKGIEISSFKGVKEIFLIGFKDEIIYQSTYE